jgi:hypothetical protein
MLNYLNNHLNNFLTHPYLFSHFNNLLTYLHTCPHIHIYLPYLFTYPLTLLDALPNSLMDSIVSPKVKTTKGEGIGTCSLAHNTLGVERCVRPSGWTRTNDKWVNYLHESTQIKQQVG